MTSFVKASSVIYFIILLLLIIAKVWHHYLYGPTIEMSDVKMIWPLKMLQDILVWALLLLVFYTYALLLTLFLATIIMVKRLRILSTLLITVIIICLFVLPFTAVPHNDEIFRLFFPILLYVLYIFLRNYKLIHPDSYKSTLLLSLLFIFNVGVIYFTDLYAWVTD